MTWRRTLLRSGAVAIAVLGAIDPAITTTRVGRPEVAVLATDARGDSALVTTVRQQLGHDYRIVTAPLPSTAATVVVGDQLPPAQWRVEGPVVAVVPSHPTGRLNIESFTVPTQVQLEGGVTLSAVVRVRGAAGRRMRVQLRDGARLAYEQSDSVTTDDAWRPLAIPFAPVRAGAAELRLDVTVGDGAARATAHVDALVEVRAEPWAVLSYDTHPSWQATFVRRALERDPRFAVTSRVGTSRNVSAASGPAPPDLSNPDALAPFGVVLVGAPEELTLRDVAGLEAYLRRRAGRVILLPESADDAPYRQRLIAGRWQQDSSGRVVMGVPTDSAHGSLRGGNLLWPAPLPNGAEVLATAMVQGVARPVVWRNAVGSGEVVVAGVVDAWSSRDPEQSGFDGFWGGVVADLASSAPAALEGVLGQATLVPGDSTDLVVTLRDIALDGSPQAAPASVAARLEGPDGEREPLRLWPDWSHGTLRGVVRPAAPGAHRVVITYRGTEVTLPLSVIAGAEATHRATDDLWQSWMAGNGGTVLSSTALGQLPTELRRIMRVSPRPDRWHPMRSPWWILPFAALVSLEWWLRRRDGER
jgi:hypothetical protein